MLFENFNLKPFLLTGLKNEKMISPTPVQEKIIPLALNNQNLIVESPTGSGKTHAFLIPLLEKIDPTKAEVQSMIISPTRELAIQTFNFLKALIPSDSNIKIKCLVGGKDLGRQENDINAGQPHIIVGNPSRIRKLYELNALKITTGKIVVIDECDMIFELGFLKDVDFMLGKMRENVQIMVFSARIPQSIQPFLDKYLKSPEFISLNKENKLSSIKHVLIEKKNQRIEKLLLELLKTFDPYVCLIFVNNKNDIKTFYKLLNENNYSCAMLHGDLPARERNQIFKRLKNLEYKYVICSDIAARGIDVPGISHVISLDLPDNYEYYIHRAGRTGRLNNTGYSYVFYDNRKSKVLEKITKTGIEFQGYTVKNEELIPLKVQSWKKKPKQEPDSATVQLLNRHKNTQIKPRYKKVLNEKLDEMKKQKRRQHIKDSIAKVKKEAFKKRRKELFEEGKE